MDETLIWCAVIGAVAYAIKPMLPTYYELTKVSQHRLDLINDTIDDLEQKVASLVMQIVELDQTVTHNCLRLAVLEDKALDVKTGSPENEARHD